MTVRKDRVLSDDDLLRLIRVSVSRAEGSRSISDAEAAKIVRRIRQLGLDADKAGAYARRASFFATAPIKRLSDEEAHDWIVRAAVSKGWPWIATHPHLDEVIQKTLHKLRAKKLPAKEEQGLFFHSVGGILASLRSVDECPIEELEKSFLSGVHGVLPDAQIEDVRSKFDKTFAFYARPEHRYRTNVVASFKLAGFRHATDVVRAQKNAEVRRAEGAIVLARMAEERKAHEGAIAELGAIFRAMRADPTISSRPARMEALRYTEALLRNPDLSDAAIVEDFPGTSREQRQQWRTRVLNAVWPRASANLRAHLVPRKSSRHDTSA